VNKGHDQGRFERKLRMLRAPLFSLLQICQSKEFAKNARQTKVLKDGTIKYLQYESKKFLEKLRIEQKLEGWEQVLEDKCTRNELMDIKSVN